MVHLRSVFPGLQDGWNLVQWGNWTYEDQFPGSNDAMTEVFGVLRDLPLTPANFHRHPRWPVLVVCARMSCNETTSGKSVLIGRPIVPL